MGNQLVGWAWVMSHNRCTIVLIWLWGLGVATQHIGSQRQYAKTRGEWDTAFHGQLSRMVTKGSGLASVK